MQNLQFYLTRLKGTSGSKLPLVKIKDSIQEKIDGCSNIPVVLSCRDHLCRELVSEKPKYVTVQKCYNRICPKCLRARIVRVRKKYIPKARQLKRPRFITLTIKGHHELNFKMKKDVDKSFKMLFQYLRRGRFVYRYIKALEVVKKEDGYYFHYHVIYEGRYIHKPKLSAKWKQYTGSSYIVDIGEVKNRIRVGLYVTKYITKGSFLDMGVEEFLEIRKMQFFATGGKFWSDKVIEIWDKLICPVCGLKYKFDFQESESYLKDGIP